MLWRLPPAENVLEITVPRGRQRNHPCDAEVHWSSLGAPDVAVIDAIPVTTPTRTLIDIAAVLSRDLVEEALDDALRRGLTSIPRLRWQIERLSARGRRGIESIRSLVAEGSEVRRPNDSVFATRLARKLRAAGLTDAVSQYPIYDGKKLLAIVDFAFPYARVAVEADGYEWHSGRTRWKHDLVRRNALTTRGWKVVHATWGDLNSDAFIEQLHRVLGR
jgi:very-short-patch-repair endonuclease